MKRTNLKENALTLVVLNTDTGNDFGTEKNDKKVKKTEDEPATVDPEWKTIYQWLNLISYIVCVTCNYLSQRLLPTSLAQIALQYDVRFDPATWAFAIWAVIYGSISIYAVGQILPDDLVPKPQGRNEDLLVNKIKWYFCANFFANASWLFLFQSNTVATFWISQVVICAMLASALWILYLSLQERLSTWEVIGLRCGFSVYCAWLTAATILGFSVSGKASGLSDANFGTGFESAFAIAIVWIGWAVFAASAWWQKNPLYAAVMFWPYYAVANQAESKGRMEIMWNIYIILSIHAAYVIFGFSYLIYNKVTYGKTGKKEELTGLFY